MTTTLLVRFPWGRYHATPWGSHVNEARVEIPPSPWRLLRALYSTWRLRRPDLDEDVVTGLLGQLAAPPIYHVPPHSLAGTRHYYPDSKHRQGATGSTDLTLDAYAVLSPETPIAIHWPFTLDVGAHDALAALAASTPYLGRADSLCEMEFATTWTPPDDGGIAMPLDLEDADPEDRTTIVDLLAPTLPLDLEALLQRPVDVRRDKLRFPRSSRHVPYRMASDVQEPAPSPRRRRREPAVPPAVRLALVGPARPALTDAVAICDSLRQAGLSRLGDPRPGDPDHNLIGRQRESKDPMVGHQHAHYLAVGEDGRVSDLVVWVPGGWTRREADAVRSISYVWLGQRSRGVEGDRSKLEVRPSAVGSIAEVAPELTGPARVWVSATPYTSPRHRKGDAETFFAREIRRELDLRPPLAGADVTSVSIVSPPAGSPDWTSFVRARPSKRFQHRQGRARSGGWGQGEAPDAAAFIEIRFREPVAGPVALGHLSHFGLGLFRPVE